MIDLGGQPRILVITLRRLGDVLLTTPLVRTLKAGHPGTAIDALVFRGTEGMLAGNRDLDHVIAMPQRASGRELGAVVGRLWRRYDLAVPTQTGDRVMLLAWAAGRRRIGFVDPGSGAWWKRRVLHRAVAAQPQNHRVDELLRLTDALGLARAPDLVCPTGPVTDVAPAGRYAVLHANPMFRIRRWTDDGWRALARALAERGLTIVATGGPDPAERQYLDRVWQDAGPPIMRLDGKLDWPGLAALLRRASVYVGPDTSMTHLAAGAGAPTVGIYGPASPSLMGPWPIGGLSSPWARAGRIQHRGNVWVVQNPLPCMPCDKLGCEGHLESYSRCLDELAVAQVLSAVDEALRGAAPHQATH
jgi:heptosyltransferase-3